MAGGMTQAEYQKPKFQRSEVQVVVSTLNFNKAIVTLISSLNLFFKWVLNFYFSFYLPGLQSFCCDSCNYIAGQGREKGE